MMKCTCNESTGGTAACPVHGFTQHRAGAAHPSRLNVLNLYVGGD